MDVDMNQQRSADRMGHRQAGLLRTLAEHGLIGSLARLQMSTPGCSQRRRRR
jgi:hypothetical protein